MSISNLFSPNTYDLHAGSISPALSSAQRLALTPSVGALVYDTTLNELYIYTGVWSPIAGGFASTTKSSMYRITNQIVVPNVLNAKVNIFDNNTFEVHQTGGGIPIDIDGIITAPENGVYKFTFVSVSKPSAPAFTGDIILNIADELGNNSQFYTEWSNTAPYDVVSLNMNATTMVTMAIGDKLGLWITNNTDTNITFEQAPGFPPTTFCIIEYIGV